MPEIVQTAEPPSRTWPWLRWTLVGVAFLAAAVAGYLYWRADVLVERYLRPATIALLEDRFDSQVALASLRVRVTPSFTIRGEGLTLRHKGRTDIPPLIAIRAFTIDADVGELWNRRIDRVHLEGLEISIPPRRGADMPSLKPPAQSLPHAEPGRPNVFIRELVTEDSLLTIAPKREGKRPRVFQLRRIRFENFEFGRAVPFDAALTNPTPTGEITTGGTFGPWNGAEPSLTPVDGTFIFDADLATIKGIGGALHAEGTFSGPLEYIRTTGKTRTEDFSLSTGGATFPLIADYVAIVDGTNGDTTLERVEARLGESHITARGAVVGVEGVRGRRITLDTTAKGGRLEDFVKLTTRVATSPMTGLVNVTAKLDIPPGEPEVIERMRLDGRFDVAEARFTSEAIQRRIDELSRRGQGRPTDETIDDVASNLRGVFELHEAVMRLRSLSFRVRGAEVRLGGTYGAKSERLNFAGTLRLQARASQTQTGWKSLVLKLFDPLLDGEGAGTVLPISITGTRDNPRFAADIKRAILR